jgi:hypothetical protein
VYRSTHSTPPTGHRGSDALISRARLGQRGIVPTASCRHLATAVTLRRRVGGHHWQARPERPLRRLGNNKFLFRNSGSELAQDGRRELNWLICR